MKAAILAGGEGSRLGNNRPYNKHVALVYDELMIHYPMMQAKAFGCDAVDIISTPSGVGDIARVIGNGERYDMNAVEYHVQKEPLGMADALGYVAIKDLFVVLCGDSYFDPPIEKFTEPTLWWTRIEDNLNQGSVYLPEENRIVEKPPEGLSDKAVIGAYAYDGIVFDIIPTLMPSNRGELEIADLNNWCLEQGIKIKEYKGFYGDMGTPNGLLRVANHIASKK